jgi:hypothetical protein
MVGRAIVGQPAVLGLWREAGLVLHQNSSLSGSNSASLLSLKFRINRLLGSARDPLPVGLPAVMGKIARIQLYSFGTAGLPL